MTMYEKVGHWIPQAWENLIADTERGSTLCVCGIHTNPCLYALKSA